MIVVVSLAQKVLRNIAGALLRLKNLLELLEVRRFDVHLFGVVSIDERAVLEQHLRVDRIEPIVPATGEEVVTVVSVGRLKVELLLDAMQPLLLLFEATFVALLLDGRQVRLVDAIQVLEIRIHLDVPIENAVHKRERERERCSSPLSPSE